MKIYIFVTLTSLSIALHAQDTLQVSSKIEASSYLFSELDQELYDYNLLDRALTNNQITIQQIKGDYNQIHDLNIWMNLYTDIALAYTDTSLFTGMAEMSDLISNFFYFVDMETDEELIQPFSLIFQNVSYIDSIHYFDGSLDVVDNKLVPTGNENELYRKGLLKSACILEFYPDNGFSTGQLYYDESFISTSADISINSMLIDVGNGFQTFGSENPLIEYSREFDSTIATLIVNYSLGKRSTIDTLRFYLTTSSNLDEFDFGRTVENWDYKKTRTGLHGIDYRIGYKYGCGSNENIKRPIIFVSPYRPPVQVKSMLTFWKQFNFKSLFLHLSDMGYDVIFINEKPGNASIEQGGLELASFITEINNEKALNYPDESWENILVGFSAGGQHARYALMYLEKNHMENNGQHPHTRLYIPFDSPHLGASVPFLSQTVYKYLSDECFAAMMPWNSFNDAASCDMNYYHIAGSSIDESTNPYVDIDPHAHPYRTALDYEFENNFSHQFTPTGDLRKIFPSFCRNVAISTGSYSDDYTEEYGLTPGMNLFSLDHTALELFPPGTSHQIRNLYASDYDNTSANTVFSRNDIFYVAGLIPVHIEKQFRTIAAYDFDLAQGGYKTEFYNGLLTSAVFALQQDGNAPGTLYYTHETMFLPLVSALAINPTIWENNNLYYNLQDSGLMYQKFNYIINLDESDIFGYPHLAHPSDHFQITPFEAVFADPYTYDHIKMQESVDEYNLDDTYLVYLRNFICDEVEGESVFLQNKTIGNNHVQTNPNYVYHAWYKARNEIVIGRQVTPKTDIGDYIIESTGDITVYAGNAVILLPGFHAQAGSEFHAYIDISDCDASYGGRSAEGGGQGSENEKTLLPANEPKVESNENDKNQINLYPNPNDGSFVFQTNLDLTNATISIFNLTGQQVYTSLVTRASNNLSIDLEKGVYLVVYQNSETRETIKMVIQ